MSPRRPQCCSPRRETSADGGRDVRFRWSLAAGFTLIEVLAVMFLTSVVLSVALSFYIDLSNATARAADGTREVRRATTLLDRIARDFEGAVLVEKRGGDDRLGHPWVFIGENHHSVRGSDHIKFITGSFSPKRSDVHESNVAVVAFTVERDEADRLTLMRFTAPRLPDRLDTDFPLPEESLLLAKDVQHFGVRFQDDEGGWLDEWDSSQIVQADRLPVAVEISLSLYDPYADPGEVVELEALDTVDESGDGNGGPIRTFQRTVVLPVRPFDLAMLLDPEGPYGTKQTDGESDKEAEEKDKASDGKSGNPESDSDRSNAENLEPEEEREDPNAPCTSGPTVSQCFNHAAALESPRGQQNLATWGSSQQCFASHGHLMDQDFILPGCR